ncbi:anti-sigma factor [Pontiella sp.]|uniref:anti-sigma factor family protein n=1 Tax=Pontiella sp. TaxID=2837462 RepID=UPI0035626549
MKCQDIEKLILLQDSGELPARQARRLAAHVHDCTSCQQFQHALIEAQHQFQDREEPTATAVQNVLRQARVNAPATGRKTIPLFGLKPALAMAASALIALGLYVGSTNPNQVGMELVMSETQLLDTEGRSIQVMYEGFSEDDLAFNFLMTYDGG